MTARQVHFNCLGAKENERAFKRAIAVNRLKLPLICICTVDLLHNKMLLNKNTRKWRIK